MAVTSGRCPCVCECVFGCVCLCVCLCIARLRVHACLSPSLDLISMFCCTTACACIDTCAEMCVLSVCIVCVYVCVCVCVCVCFRVHAHSVIIPHALEYAAHAVGRTRTHVPIPFPPSPLAETSLRAHAGYAHSIANGSTDVPRVLVYAAGQEGETGRKATTTTTSASQSARPRSRHALWTRCSVVTVCFC